MVTTVHDEFYIRGNRAKLTNNELVTVEVKVIKDVPLKILWVFKIIIIVSVVADDNVGILDNVLQINQS